MEDITKQEYSAWLEEALGTLPEIHPTSLCAVAMAADGTTFTSYYNAGPSCKAVFANHIQSDIVMDISCEFCIAWWCDLYERFLDSDENGPLPCEECLESGGD